MAFMPAAMHNLTVHPDNGCLFISLIREPLALALALPTGDSTPLGQGVYVEVAVHIQPDGEVATSR